MIQILAIVVALGLLIFLAYRGYPVIIIAPLVTLLAVILSGGHLLPSYTETYMTYATKLCKIILPNISIRCYIWESNGDEWCGGIYCQDHR